MRVLVVGVGVIGSYLTHVVYEAGHDVTVVARGSWAQTLRTHGLVIHHRFQHKTTVDHPRVVETVPDEHFDVAFSVMRQDQQLAAVPELAAIDADLLVLVGNDLHAGELDDRLWSAARPLLFGFQSSAGQRGGDHVECVRWGVMGLDVGPLHGEATAEERALLDGVFTGHYRAHWTHDFRDWLVTHATAILPMCFASYICHCDRRRATDDLLHRVVSALAEGYALIDRVGFQILPESDRGLFDGGMRARAMHGFVWLLAHTSLGTLCIDDHCRHAPDEMQSLDEAFQELRGCAPEFPMPAWDDLRRQMGSWEDVRRSCKADVRDGR